METVVRLRRVIVLGTVAAALLQAGTPALAAPAKGKTPPAKHHAKKHPAKQKRVKAKAKKQAARPAAKTPAPAVSEIPVVFTVRNTNTSNTSCPADGKTYEIRGHLVGPAARLASATPQGAALYVHGLGYGEFFWRFKGVPGYDYAGAQAAQAGLVSVTIDRLGYGASGRPDGNQVCYGSEGDYLHQIVTQLRSGAYATPGRTAAAPRFSKLALVGHSAGGFMVEAEAASFKDVDALILAGFGNTGPGLPAYAAFGRATLDCNLTPLPGNYAFFGKTDADFKAAHFANADPAVVDAVTAMRAPDPCGDFAGAPASIVADVLGANSIKGPVLIVDGADDALFPPPAGDNEKLLFTGNPDVTLVTLPGTGHAVTLGRTAPRFRSVVGDWLRGHGF
jgi:pimeloyl-ACP methyl ester carboxylesterase